MVTGLLTIIWSILRPLVAQMPDISISQPISSNVLDYIRCGLYFFPMDTVARILACLVGLWVFRVIVSLIHTVWDLIPIAWGDFFD